MPSIAHDESEEDDSDDDLEQRIEHAHAENFHHDPVSVPKHANPFSDDETMELFHDTLSAADENGIVPPGYGLLPEEWEDGVYPTYEILKSGRRGGKRLRVALPDSIWRPRAEMWGRGLAISNQLSYINES
ncbi:hypothetical protein DFH09DRAFT_897524 [Mycena vulgaris]|nr:hypothetical protein DFH09DRAFT_897524 [Mycena vulgaris]